MIFRAVLGFDPTGPIPSKGSEFLREVSDWRSAASGQPASSNTWVWKFVRIHRAPFRTSGATSSIILAFLAAAGDIDGARVVLETLGRLLAPAVRPSDDRSRGGVVVDLEAERERRAAR